MGEKCDDRVCSAKHEIQNIDACYYIHFLHDDGVARSTGRAAHSIQAHRYRYVWRAAEFQLFRPGPILEQWGHARGVRGYVNPGPELSKFESSRGRGSIH